MITLSPDLTDSSVKIIRISQSDIPSQLGVIRDAYIDGNIIVIENYQFDIDYSLFDFDPLHHDDDNKLKKAKASDLMNSLDSWPDHALYAYTADIQTARKMQAAMDSCQEEIRRLFISIFPEITKMGSLCTWRFTHTDNEEYHFDIYPDQQLILRAFYNLDQIDRVWGWGHNALDALAATNMPAEQRVSSSINKVLNEWIENQPHHIVRFPQNCLWLCDSLKVAHQIISGRKMAAFTYNADPAPFSRSRLLFKNYISG